jgi:hypothetical protein
MVNVSNLKTKGQFKWRSVYNGDITLKGCILIDKIQEINNEFIFKIKINNSHLKTIRLLENSLRKIIINENCYLKEQVFDNNIITLKLISTKQKIKTNILNCNGNQKLYSELFSEQLLDIDLTVDSIWAHSKYFPNFVYKLKPSTIYACE